MGSSKHTYHQLDLLRRSSPTSSLRVIALIDFDAFYAQCETVRLNLPPTVPLAVQQWNAIIALNYPARECGLKRGASVEEAKRLCPDIVLQHVATWREGETTWAYRSDFAKHMSTDKSALDPYRLQSRKCFEFVRSLLPDAPVQRVEKASIDEVFLDLSTQIHNILLEQFPEPKQRPSDPGQHLPLPSFSSPLDWEGDHVVNLESADPRPDWDDIALNIGADIVRRIRADILARFKYTCSAGIARNKMLAKLGAGFRKPNQQTVIPNQAIDIFLATHKLTKIRGLGGKLGQQVIDAFGSDRVADVVRISLEELKSKLGNHSGSWVYDIVCGRDKDIVTPRVLVQSMLSAKTFVPSLSGFEQAMKWLRIFAADLMGRLNELQNEHPRQPTTIALHHHINGRFGPMRTKQAVVPQGSTIDEMALFSWSKTLLRDICDQGPAWPCASLSVSISGFTSPPTQNHRITSFFARGNSTGKRAVEALGRGEDQQREPKRARNTCKDNKIVERIGWGHKSSTEPSAGAVRTPQSEPPQIDGNADYGFLYHCPKCSKSVPAPKVLEHLDWHTALEMQDRVDQ